MRPTFWSICAVLLFSSLGNPICLFVPHGPNQTLSYRPFSSAVPGQHVIPVCGSSRKGPMTLFFSAAQFRTVSLLGEILFSFQDIFPLLIPKGGRSVLREVVSFLLWRPVPFYACAWGSPDWRVCFPTQYSAEALFCIWGFLFVWSDCCCSVLWPLHMW